MAKGRVAIVRELDGYLTKWKRTLHLDGWTLKYWFSRKDCDDGDEITAETRIDFRYMLCTITVYPHILTLPKADREHVIVHELCHCITNQMDELLYRMQRGLLVTERERKDAREVVTQKMSKAVFELSKRVS